MVRCYISLHGESLYLGTLQVKGRLANSEVGVIKIRNCENAHVNVICIYCMLGYSWDTIHGVLSMGYYAVISCAIPTFAYRMIPFNKTFAFDYGFGK